MPQAKHKYVYPTSPKVLIVEQKGCPSFSPAVPGGFLERFFHSYHILILTLAVEFNKKSTRNINRGFNVFFIAIRADRLNGCDVGGSECMTLSSV